MTNGSNKGRSRVHGFPTKNMGSQNLCVSLPELLVEAAEILESHRAEKSHAHDQTKDTIISLPFCLLLATPITNYTSARMVAPPPSNPVFSTPFSGPRSPGRVESGEGRELRTDNGIHRRSKCNSIQHGGRPGLGRELDSLYEYRGQ
jgi:hypothetical protein